MTTRRPDTAYLDTLLWLPKSRVNVRLIKQALVVTTGGETTPLWVEEGDHIGLPRCYLQADELPDIEVIDCRPKSYPKVDITSRVSLDARNPEKTIQRDAALALLDSDGGVLHVRCGAGKTPVMLHVAAERGGPVLILVHKTMLLEQWTGEIKGTSAKAAKLAFDGDIGLIKGPPKKWKWKHPITLASIQSLTRHADAVTQEMREWFSTVIWDECFVAGTSVDDAPIESLRPGYLVTSYDEDTGQLNRKRVTRTRVGMATDLVSVHVSEDYVTCTPNHPFLTQSGWVAAGALSRLDRVLCYGPEKREQPTWKAVDRIEVHEQTDDGTFGGYCPHGVVFNLSIDATPTYVVGRQRIVVHNCHHLPAKELSKTAALFPGQRYGCTATARRTDGTEFVLFAHLGKILFEYLEHDIKPTCVFIKSPTVVDLQNPSVRSAVLAGREIHHTRLARFLGEQPSEIQVIDFLVKQCAAAGRTALFVSRSKDKVQQLHERWPNSAALHQDVDEKSRLRLFLENSLAFGTMDMASEALDKGSLDTLVLLEETENSNILAQSIGRAQRGESEKTPIVYVIWHVEVPVLEKHGKTIMSWMRARDYEVKVVL